MALTDKLKAIGDAIRAKTGKADTLTLDQMVTEIEGITTGGGGGSSALVAKSLVRHGSGYIDTGIDSANSNITIQLQYEFETMPTGYWYVIRAYVNESTNSIRILYNGSNGYTYCCLNSLPSASLTVTQKRYPGVVYTDVLKPESTTVISYATNGVKVTRTKTSGAAIVGENISIFNISTNDGVSVKLYYLKIYDGNTLVRDYVPFIAEDGECGLYDLVTKQFYGNAGNGKFEAEKVAVIE